MFTLHLPPFLNFLPNWMDRLAEKEHLNVSKVLQDAIYKLIGNKHYV